MYWTSRVGRLQRIRLLRGNRFLSSASVEGRNFEPTPSLQHCFDEQLKVFQLVKEYQSKGHLVANLDPLKLAKDDPGKAPFLVEQIPELQKESYGFSNSDLERIFYIGDLIPGQPSECTLAELLKKLRAAYCGPSVVEYSHIKDRDVVDWLKGKAASRINNPRLYDEQRVEILRSLLQAQLFEEFCGKRFSGAKRFSLEGCEALIPGLNQLFYSACEQGVETIEMGMTHRGRLNVLHNSLQMPIEALLLHFQSYLPDDNEHPNNSDDVRYHLGTTRLLQFGDKSIRVSVAANPSHLEAINSVVLGKTRARQFLLRGDLDSALDWDSPLGKIGSSLDYSPSDFAKKKCLGLLIHGDASFYQGSVRESLGFSNLRDYSTGGTVHVIINNQIGFTTMAKESHSSIYCSDVATSIGAPIFHVNSDHPEEVVRVFREAVEYRQNFGKDCVINLWCYRRQGHNEQDRPEVTQPIMYNAISYHDPVATRYYNDLQRNGVAVGTELNGLKQEIMNHFVQGYDSMEQEPQSHSSFMSLWNEIGQKNDTKEEAHSALSQLNTEECIASLCESTGVNVELLRSFGRAIFKLPEDSLSFHPKVVSMFKQRKKSISSIRTSSISWASAEALAFASLLVDGYHIRLSGQDVERGTFNQRHAVLYDQVKSKNGEEEVYKPWTALQARAWHNEDMRRQLIRHHSDRDESEELDEESIPEDVAKIAADSHQQISRTDHHRRQIVKKSMKIVKDACAVSNDLAKAVGVMEICNSPLSEEAVLGFEHGYSLYSPIILTLWEAQFGDFANCAQTVIDTFIASGEEKWVRPSGLVMLLPHGYEGQGPDHSSAKLERFLQLCSQDETPVQMPETSREEYVSLSKVNMHVLVPTTPAQYFHLLRRQMLMPFRKPLVVLTPKQLLHHKPCSSSLLDMDYSTYFQPVITDTNCAPNRVERIVLCSGKLYYALVQARKLMKLTDSVAIVRVEQLHPFPFVSLPKALEAYFGESSCVKKIIWAQEEPKNMGAWSYIKPRVDKVIRSMDVDGVEFQYVGRPASASPATGSYQLHREEMTNLVSAAIADP